MKKRRADLAACLMSLPNADRATAKISLGIPGGVEAIYLIQIGYPKGKFGPV